MSHAEDWEDVWLERIQESIRGLEYGTVQIVVHNGKVVQIDRTERHRFDSINSALPSKNKGK